MKQIKLSPSRLNTFIACKRCFWMAMHGKAVPGGFPMALLNVMDGIQKRYYDKYRSKGLPPLLKGEISLKLVDPKTAEKLRKYLIWHDKKTDAVLRGKMDDCFIDSKGVLVVMDNKTRSGDFKQIYPEYKFQLETYAFLLQQNGYKVNSKKGYIVYFQPDKTSNIEKGVKFTTDIKPVKLNPDIVPIIFRRAVALARKSKPPKEHAECELCTWIREIREL